MSGAKVGESFITHEYDEAIAVQQTHRRCRDEAGDQASDVVGEDRHQGGPGRGQGRSSSDLKSLGKPHGATGKIEDVAKGLKGLMEETLETATTEGADSDYYEAHAVLLNIKRKQMDSAGGMLEIARATKDTELARPRRPSPRPRRRAARPSLTNSRPSPPGSRPPRPPDLDET